jgi:hypothetical protein
MRGSFPKDRFGESGGRRVVADEKTRKSKKKARLLFTELSRKKNHPSLLSPSLY